MDCSEIQYEVKEGVHGEAYNLDGESSWTPVVGKKKRRVPDFIKRRFPPDHSQLIHLNLIVTLHLRRILVHVIPTGPN